MFGKRRFLGCFSLFLLAAAPVPAQSRSPDPHPAAAAEPQTEASAAAGNPLDGWYSTPAGTVFADSAVPFQDAPSIRIERNIGSKGGFSMVSRSMPINFVGSRIELRGHLRTRDVSAFAGLWLREDGAKPAIEFDNMQSRHLAGTTDWAEYAIELPLNAKATTLVYGMLLAGTGAVWGEPPRLFVDGKPIAEIERRKTVFDTDREFDKGSRVRIDALSGQQLDSLVLAGEVWGFLKYFHPALTAGGRQWDYELFRWLPRILAAKTPQETRRLLVEWIDALGPLPACDSCAREPVGAAVPLPSPTEWARDEARLGPLLSARLVNVYRKRKPETQFYVSLASDAGNAVFENEPSYEHVALPDAGFQILAAYRLWAIVAYWFPYRDRIPGSWSTALRENLGAVAQARDGGEFDRAMLKFVARIADTHANLWSSLAARPPQGRCALPAAVRFIEDRAVVAEIARERTPDPLRAADFMQPAAAAGITPNLPSGLRRGDVILRLDGTPVGELVELWSPYFADSNDAARKRDIARSMTRGACGEANLDIEREGQPLHLRARRVPAAEVEHSRWHDLPGDAFRLLSPDVAYLKLSSIKSGDVAGYVELARNTKGLVIDLRNYPSDFVVFSLGSLLVDAKTPFALFAFPTLSDPGVFRWGDEMQLTPASPHYAGKVAVLVDETTQSQAEYTAMALRAAPRAIVIGSTTAGADGNVSTIPLPGGRSAMISGLGVFYPDRRPTQQIGIVPDIVVEPTLRGIRDGRDEIIERALREILGPGLSAEALRKLYR